MVQMSTKQVPYFTGTSPCKDCPYRTDAPLAKWAIEEFKDLLLNDKSQLGACYNCHQKNGSVCRGWLMDQDRRYFLSIALRIKMSKDGITREYLDALHSPIPLYDSMEDMIEANYPELIK
jgi:hypothetical protein